MRRKSPEPFLVPKKPSGLPPYRAKDLRYTLEQVGLACPVCAAGTTTLDSRPRSGGIRRRRCCIKCGHRFTTWESVGDNPQLAKISFQTVAHELRQLTERFERLAALNGETDGDEEAA